MTAEHTAYIIDYPSLDQGYAACSCGWEDPRVRTVRDLAQADANAHELAMLVGEDGEVDDRLTTSVF